MKNAKVLVSPNPRKNVGFESLKLLHILVANTPLKTSIFTRRNPFDPHPRIFQATPSKSHSFVFVWIFYKTACINITYVPHPYCLAHIFRYPPYLTSNTISRKYGIFQKYNQTCARVFNHVALRPLPILINDQQMLATFIVP